MRWTNLWLTVIYSLQKNLFVHLFIYMHIGVLPTCMSVCHVCVWHLQRPEDSIDWRKVENRSCCSEESIRFPGTRVTGGCELPCGSWESNSGPLEEQLVLLTAEPSPQPPSFRIWIPCQESFPESTDNRTFFFFKSFSLPLGKIIFTIDDNVINVHRCAHTICRCMHMILHVYKDM